MIQHKQETECHTGKSINTSQFGMVASEKAFNILSDSLYTHKERATIREYCTNAYDSHQESGKLSTPFRVHVPTELEPFFEVEDYGIGLDEEEVMSTFATFFLSTKEDRAEVNGCLGLGSKAAFTVSDQFTITAIKDGDVRVFLCYKNKMGIPEVALKSKRDTDKGNGVTIRIPVSTKKITLWQREMAEILSCFESLPEGNLNAIKDKLDLLHQEKMELRASKEGIVSLNGSGIADIMMGNVVYPIDKPLQYVKCTNMRKMLEGIINVCDIHLVAELGEVSFAPSREALSLNRYTKRALTRKITKLAFAKYKELVEELSGGGNYYTLYHKFHKTSSWGVFKEMVFPFTNGNSLSYYEREWDTNHLYILKSIQGIGSVRGLVPSVNGSGLVFSSSFTYMNHRRIREWEDITLCRGTVKNLRKSMENCRNKLDCDILLWVPDDVCAKSLCNFFGLDYSGVIDLTPYQVVTERKKAPPRPRKERRDTVMVKVLQNREVSYQEVDLSEEGLCYLPQGEVSFNTSIIEGERIPLRVDTWRFKRIVESLGVSKVLLLNKNNENKVLKSGVVNIYTLWKSFVKANKKSLIKACVWEPTWHDKVEDGFNSVDTVLLGKSKAFKKYKTLRDSAPNHALTGVVSADQLGLSKDKTFIKESDRRTDITIRVEEDVERMKAKLPLWGRLRSEEDAKYYLKLEKLTK